MVGLSVHGSGGGGYLVLSRRVARATTTWAHASAPRWGERYGFEVSRLPDFWPFWGGRAYSLRPPWHVPGGPWVWSLGLFSSIFFSTSINKKKYLPDREASLIKKEYCRLSASTLPTSDPYLELVLTCYRRAGQLAPIFGTLGVS